MRNEEIRNRKWGNEEMRTSCLGRASLKTKLCMIYWATGTSWCSATIQAYCLIPLSAGTRCDTLYLYLLVCHVQHELAWFRHQIYLRNGTYMYCPTPSPTVPINLPILAVYSPISQSGGQVIINGLDSMSTSTCTTAKKLPKLFNQFLICQSCRKAAGSNDISTLYWYHIQSRYRVKKAIPITILTSNA